MNGKILKCERCGYILTKRDNDQIYQDKQIISADKGRNIVLCRFCKHDLDNFIRGFPIWATNEFKEVSERYHGMNNKKDTYKIITLREELRQEMEKCYKGDKE